MGIPDFQKLDKWKDTELPTPVFNFLFTYLF